MYQRSYSLMEIKRCLEASEQIPLNEFTQGHGIERHSSISDVQLRARAMNKGTSVSAFAKGRLADQFHSVAFLLNSSYGQQALQVLDFLDGNLVETKKGNAVTRVAVTGSIETGSFPKAGARFAHSQGPLGTAEQVKAEKMTVVLELKPRGFPAPLYIVTAFPQPSCKPNRIEPTLQQAKNWNDKAEEAVGLSISRLFS